MIEKVWLPFVLAILFTSVFYIALVSKPVLNGADTYFYYSFSCGKIDSLNEKGFLAELIFSNIPCDVGTWKLIEAGLAFLVSLLIGLIGFELLGSKGWWAMPLSWMSFILPFVYSNLEPTQFGFVFCLVSLYFLIKKEVFLSLVSIVWAGLIWQGTVVFLLVLGLIYWPFILLGLIIVIPNFVGFVGSVYTRADVAESSSIAAAKVLGFSFPVPVIIFLFFFFWSFKLYFDSKELWKFRTWFNFDIRKQFFLATMACVVLAGWGFKWALIGLPFFVVQLTDTFIGLDSLNEKLYVLGTLLLFIIACLIVIPNDIPTSGQMEAVEKVVSLSADGRVQNDWSPGHWILSEGGFPSREFGADQNAEWFACDSRPVLTELDLNSEFELVWFNRNYKIYQCRLD